MKKLMISLAAGAALLAAGAANASTVHWSIGINLPPVATVVSSGPVYAPRVVYPAPRRFYEPAPVVYAPRPEVYETRPVVYAPRVVYAPAPIVRRVPRARVVYRRPIVVVPAHGHRWNRDREERRWHHH